MTYEELLKEAMEQIPLYSREWTNYNPSDPGITILENLTAFQAVQQKALDTVTDRQKQKLLELAGLAPEPESLARVLVGTDRSAAITFPKYQKFLAGNTCYETKEAVTAAGKICGIYVETDGEKLDYTALLQKEMPVTMPLFGTHPKVGDSLYLVLDDLSADRGSPLHFYLDMEERYPRNPWQPGEEVHLAKAEWSIYTKKGFELATQVQDDTAGFLRSGEISLLFQQAVPKRYEKDSVQGYVLKGTLVKAEYDVAPWISAVYGPLFPLYQRDTKAALFCQKGQEWVCIPPVFPGDMYLFVYGRENPQDPEYSFYQEAPDEDCQGRYYEKKVRFDGTVQLYFSKERFGQEPSGEPDSLYIVCCCEEFLQYRKLEQVFGYDDQRMTVYGMEHMEYQSLRIMAEKRDRRGRLHYQFFQPEETGEGKLRYTYEDEKKEICILDPGDYEGAQLYLCGCAQFLGEEGNARAGNQFRLVGSSPHLCGSGIAGIGPQLCGSGMSGSNPHLSNSGMLESNPYLCGSGMSGNNPHLCGSGLSGTSPHFFNPAPGTGGRFKETIEQIEKRLVKEMEVPWCAVTAKDYEMLVKNIPGLSIHKVRAIFEEKQGMVTVVVKPYGDARFPGLSRSCRELICQYLEARRMLTVRIAVKEPVYVPVDARAVVFLRRQYENDGEEIRRCLEQELDFVHGSQEFGETLYFNKIFAKISDLPCVEYVEELSLTPRIPEAVKTEGLDLKMNPDALCCPGKIMLDIGRGQFRR